MIILYAVYKCPCIVVNLPSFSCTVNCCLLMEVPLFIIWIEWHHVDHYTLSLRSKLLQSQWFYIQRQSTGWKTVDFYVAVHMSSRISQTIWQIMAPLMTLRHYVQLVHNVSRYILVQKFKITALSCLLLFSKQFLTIVTFPLAELPDPQLWRSHQLWPCGNYSPGPGG